MTPREFFDTVKKMRGSQKEFFRTRSSSALSQSRALEKKVDDEIVRVEAILSRKPVQGALVFEN